ncbi:MAG: DUF1573 domain-containing protein [Alistipes sp.]|jgi:hypothetical protein|nr:DUF1573 domain-containing protein [Alistipes sp.]
MRRAVLAAVALVALAFFATAFFATACDPKPATTTAGGAVFDISPEIVESRKDTLVDIGLVREGEIVQYNAAIRNAGTDPLVITSVETSCGCTEVEYERAPIAPGATGGFSFRFDSRGMWGAQHKLIEIHTSAGRRPYRVVMQAEVE